MEYRKGFLATVPAKALIIFALGVFFLFCTIGIANDMANMGRQPALRYVLSVLLISICAVGYAAAGTTMRQRSWKVMVPLFLLQFLLMNWLNRWLPLPPALGVMNAEEVARLEQRLQWDAYGIVVATFLGYACFVYASITEGRRYFRAHAEIALAQEIHQVLVPTIDMKLGGYEFYGRSSPSGEVGGDLIDVAGTAESWVAYLADVSGHGVAPGLVMGMAKSASRMLLSSGAGSEALMPRLNEVLYPLKKPDMFITFCFVAASVEGLRVGLAGHPSVLQFSAKTNEVTEIECPNMPLGIVPEGAFAISGAEAESGTMFALYTDGFLEAVNKAGEEFGVARLKAEIQKHGARPLVEICDEIKASVSRHGAQFDDQSLLLVRKI
ncbi:MAG TPA: PP2C family protein-serine/threonine phosphatase [Candidatus Dormibacteraeota bacterium]|jgi:sigma-B regulation protein RsbU (phosphoserine phosphatase)|nr:PP2C family protein-serine/threonine phosphatase [Candidatus Dormibacteraeota bacterium]